MDYNKESLEMHKKHKGKLAVTSKFPLKTKEDLSIAYTPGVAEPCRVIAKDVELAYTYTIKANSVAIVSDGSAVLGLGNIGPEAAMPVMEGKALLMKEFGNVDAYPICLATQDVEKIIETVKLISPGFGGINLEDISAPRCFEIEDRLKKELNIPIFHDDQHGTAIVVLAGVLNALKVVSKQIEEIKVVLVGAGAAGTAIAKLLLAAGVTNIIVCDSKGIIYTGRENLNSAKVELAAITNKDLVKGTLADAINDTDLFIGISVANTVSKEMVSSMADKSIVIAMANPIPEIMPELAKEAGAYIVATGRSDYPNQVNNLLVFPGMFRGLLDSRSKDITDEMKLSVAHAIANCVEEPTVDLIIPNALDKSVAVAVAKAVVECAENN
jgi:malate dehydrogenase (oxaloacetate-decarboxylating)